LTKTVPRLAAVSVLLMALVACSPAVPTETPLQTTTPLSILPTLTPPPAGIEEGAVCTLAGGEVVEQGWSGKDTGSNSCNQCRCLSAGLACTKMACPSANLPATLTPTPIPTDASTPTAQPVRGGTQSDSPEANGAATEEQHPGWTTRAPLLEPNSEFALAQLGPKIYVIGGYPSSRVTVSTVQVYDARSDSWELTNPLPIPVNHGVAATVDGKVYLMGGQANAGGNPNRAGFLDIVLEYNPASATWTNKTSMPTARSGGAAAVVAGKIYVAGGRPPRGSDFAVYDPSSDSWATLPDMPTQRNHLAATAIDDKVYVVGGRFGAGFRSEATELLEMYDPKIGSWVSLAPMPTPRSGVNGIAVRGCFHVWGGEGEWNNAPPRVFPEHEVYDPRTDSWQRVGPVPIPVHGVTGAAFIDGLIHLPGGGTEVGGSSGSLLHQAFRPEAQCQS